MILKDDFYHIMDRAISIKRLKYQRWPVHVVAQASKVFHKSGELMKAADDYKYQRSDIPIEAKAQHEDMERLCLETIATCLRFLERLKPHDTPIFLTSIEDIPIPPATGSGEILALFTESGVFLSHPEGDHAVTFNEDGTANIDQLPEDVKEGIVDQFDEPHHTNTDATGI
jgi:hypothetical protein